MEVGKHVEPRFKLRSFVAKELILEEWDNFVFECRYVADGQHGKMSSLMGILVYFVSKAEIVTDGFNHRLITIVHFKHDTGEAPSSIATHVH